MISISEYRKTLEAQIAHLTSGLVGKVRTHELKELNYDSGKVDGLRAALTILDELEAHGERQS